LMVEAASSQLSAVSGSEWCSHGELVEPCGQALSFATQLQ
jgi:hypothetical protein